MPRTVTGFSLGANQSAKLLGEDGDATPIKGCCVLGAPWNFVDGHVFLSRSYLQLVYSRAMAKNLRRVLNQSANVFKEDKRLDWDAIYGNPYQTLWVFASWASCIIALGLTVGHVTQLRIRLDRDGASGRLPDRYSILSVSSRVPVCAARRRSHRMLQLGLGRPARLKCQGSAPLPLSSRRSHRSR